MISIFLGIELSKSSQSSKSSWPAGFTRLASLAYNQYKAKFLRGEAGFIYWTYLINQLGKVPLAFLDYHAVLINLADLKIFVSPFFNVNFNAPLLNQPSGFGI